MLQHLIDAAKGKHPLSAKRSSHWAAVRRQHLELNPTCAVCGGIDKLEVHHRRPFHLHPELELEPNNLITLCESGTGGLNCHLSFGHLGTFKSWNVGVVTDAAAWLKKLLNRPLAEV